jgi:hypothetical protein
MTNKYAYSLAFLFLCMCLPGFSQEIGLEHIATYRTGVFEEGAAEIAAYDPVNKRLFFVNANASTVDILDINDPTNPVLLNSIDCTPYGSSANSVDVQDGIVAVAVENVVKQENGRVVFFDTDGNYLNDVEAGALPDMLTFTSDGLKVLVANEGEPDADYLMDPLGSVTIVDLSAGVGAATTIQVNFETYNNRKMSLINKGIRIFGNNGLQTTSQDLEPEYIALSDNDSLAYVTCQENNAIAVINIATGTVLDIMPLGYKDHSKGAPVLSEYRLDEIPWWDVFDLGAPLSGGEKIHLGGFSGLYYDPLLSTENQLSFWTVPDRGPNSESIDGGVSQTLVPFKLPDYQGRLVKLNYIKNLDQFFIDANPIFLKRQDGTPISGRSNIPGFDEVPVTQTDDTVYSNIDYTVNNINYHELEYDAFGGDFEGIVRTPDHHFWLCDEYRPSIYHFDANGTLIERYVPQGTSQLGDTPQAPGYYGAETLPEVYNLHRANRGFEAIAYDYDENIIYAFIQSPIENPNSAAVRNKSDVIRILGINPATGQPVKEYVYLLERNKYAGVGISRVDKIGDAVYMGNGVFNVLERDSSTPDDGNTGKKSIFEIRLKGATNILGTALSEKMTSTGPDDKTLEMMSADDLAIAGVQPVYKTQVLNLPSIGYLPSDKPEGITSLPDGRLVVVNDNDFGIAGAGISDAVSVGFISFDDNYGFDASNTADNIDISNHPTLGMYLPDAIASFTVDGKQYLITANEGDVRDYDAYSEEVRVKDLDLDTLIFPEADFLQEDDNLGRLIATSANGDLDGDGFQDLIYSFGSRSFTIWDEYLNQVFDSGDEFEQKIAFMDPDHFNSNNTDNDSRKSRSDDKGPEPEAVAVAEINGELYAFVGLERMGGIMTYNITDPRAPYFVDYTNNRNFEAEAETAEAGDLGVEHIVFIDQVESPDDRPLLVTANEISGTISIFGFTDGTRPENRSENGVVQEIYLEGAYPNPFSADFNISVNLIQDGDVVVEIFNALGQIQKSISFGHRSVGVNQLKCAAIENMPGGVYITIVKQNDTFVKSFSIVKQ